MIRTRWARMGRATAGAFAVATALVLAAAPAAAQDWNQDRNQDACRCVDRDGNEIENCTCFRSFGPEDGLAMGRVFDRDRARLGVTVREDQGAEFDALGARVTDVLDGGPADEAGLREGDVITRVDGRSLFDPLDGDVEVDFDLDRSIPVQRLLAIARELEPDQSVEVEYLRDGESRRTTVTTEDLGGWGVFGFREPGAPMAPGFRPRLRDLHGPFPPEAPRANRFEFRGPRGDVRVWSPEIAGPEGHGGVFLHGGDRAFRTCPADDRDRDEDGRAFEVLVGFDACFGGVELVELNPGLGAYFGTTEGVLVSDVHAQSPLGLEPGDVILRIGDRAVDTPDRVRRVLRSYDADEPITLHVRRNGREISVQGRLTHEE
ncbi:MAG: PDZ domain-containing protein [Longimicrobiales bacterium]